MARPRGRPTEQESLRIARDPLLEELRTACAGCRAALVLPTIRERNREVEDNFFRVAAAFEGFLSDWFVRCLSFDASQFRATYESRAANYASNGLQTWEPGQRLWRNAGRTVSVAVSVPVDRQLTQTEASNYLGWQGGTRSFSGAADLEGDATDFLAARFSSRVASLSNAQKQVIDSTIAIRNVLAHRSPRGVTAMNQALADGRLPAALRRGARGVRATGVGAYLRADAAGHRRFRTYFVELEQIGYVLAPGMAAPAVCP